MKKKPEKMEDLEQTKPKIKTQLHHVMQTTHEFNTYDTLVFIDQEINAWIFQRTKENQKPMIFNKIVFGSTIQIVTLHTVLTEIEI